MPIVIENVFSEAQIEELKNSINTSRFELDEKHCRSLSGLLAKNGLREDSRAKALSEDIDLKIKSICSENLSETALPTYFLASKYSPIFGGTPNLPPHLDDNACTYTIDYQLASSVDWGIVINGEEIVLKDNSAVLYDGENELHWRDSFPSRNPMDFVQMVFFHFAEPEHWFFKHPHITPISSEEIHEGRLTREAKLLIKYGKQEGSENKYV
jgi:hypothetical protein